MLITQNQKKPRLSVPLASLCCSSWLHICCSDWLHCSVLGGRLLCNPQMQLSGGFQIGCGRFLWGKKMSRHGRTQWRRYVDLSRRQQRDAVVRFRAKLRQSAASGYRVWIGSLGCDEPNRPRIYDQWEEVRFLSRQSPKTIIWRAQIETASHRFWNIARDIAGDRAWSCLSEEEIAARRSYKSMLEVCERSSTGKPLSYRLSPQPKVTYARFDGRTLEEEIDRIEAELCASGELAIHEQHVIDRNFEGGVGVRIVVDAPSITRSVVDTVVERFLLAGETNWRSESPVPRSQLPTATYEAALEAIAAQHPQDDGEIPDAVLNHIRSTVSQDIDGGKSLFNDA